jgi:predicted nuclease of predicted toxin-antitoxin system
VIPLLLDAGLPRSAAEDLRSLGWDAVHVTDADLGAAEDRAILAAALQKGRVVVTLDHDFPWLMYVGGYTSPSIVLLRVDALDRARTVELLLRVLPAVEERLRAGAVVSVVRDAARVRDLPIR